jgi:hypothetical protein
MGMTRRAWIVVAVGGIALLVGGVLIGRLSVETNDGRLAGYVQGLREGEAQGLREGRVLQQPVTSATAFNEGYAAGANDVFAGYDGGWPLDATYVITLVPGRDGITYRIASRQMMQPGVNYYVCSAKGRLCQESRR